MPNLPPTVTGIKRPDAAAHLADRFHRLRHPDGREYRFQIFNSFGQPDRVAQAQKARANVYSQAMINELELAGYVITHKDDAAATVKTGPPAAVCLMHEDKHTGEQVVLNFYSFDDALDWLDRQRDSLERHKPDDA